MTTVTQLNTVGESERQARIDLAALYRLCAHYGWTDVIDTHLSARVPGAPDQYLMHPYGLLFEEVTASSLLKSDFDGNIISGDSPNEAGHLIHSAILRARPDINFVMHTHTRAGAAVSAMACNLLPLSQHAGSVLGTIAYHPYQVVTEAVDECEALGRDIGDSFLMILHNHGLLACGRTAGEAFLYHYYLEAACKIQVDVLRSGQKCHTLSDAALTDLAKWGKPQDEPWGEANWQAMLRMLARRGSNHAD